MKTINGHSTSRVSRFTAAAIACFAALSAGAASAAIIGQLGVLDSTANGGTNPATGAAWADGDTYRLVFVSNNTVRDATATNMADYHSAITTYANNAGLPGNWYVIGMTDGTNGRVNTLTTGTGVGIFATDGTTKIADNYNDFWDGNLDNPMKWDETGTERGSLSPAVGGFANGTPEASGGRHLGGSTETPPRIHHGRSTDTGGQWARVYNGAASNQWRFYAMSEVLTVAFPVEANDDTGATDEDTSTTTLTGGATSLLDNDSPSDGAVTEIQSSLSGGPASLVTNGGSASILTEKGATVTVNQDGTFEYDPTGSLELQALAAGESTNDFFTYTMTDSAESAQAPVLVAYWPMEGDVGTEVTGADDIIDDPDHPATDAAISGTGGTWVNDPERGTVYSTTEDDRLQAGTMGIEGDFTWSVWVKSTDNSGTLLGTRAGTFFRLHTNSVSGWASINYSPDVDDGVWHHVAMRRLGNTLSVYVDGAFAGSTTRTGSLNSRFEIGGTSQFSEDVTALIDDVAIWEGALSEAQIQALATGTGVQDAVPVPVFGTATVALDITGANDAPEISVATTGEVTEDFSGGATETTSSDADQAATLVAYYPLNEGTAGSPVTGADDIIDDPTHPARDATVQGSGGTWVDDPTRGIVYGSTGRPGGDNLDAGTMGITDDFTWSMWVKTTEGGRILGTRSGTYFGLGAGGVTGSWFNLDFSPDVNDNTWHHLALKRDGDTISVWVDGVEKNSTTRTGALNSRLEIGGSSQFGEYTAGLISDVAIWDGALTATEIQALAAGQKPTEIFSDVDLIDTHTVTAAYKDGSASWSGGTLTTAQIDAIRAAGTFTADAGGWAYEIENSAIQFIDEGQTVTLGYDITVEDSSGAANDSDTQTVTITINGTKELTATILSIVRNGASPSNAASVGWAVTFDGAVTGLSESNFSLTGTLGGSSSIGTVTGSGTDWVVTASNPGGCGTLGLTLHDGTGVAPPLTNTPFEGEVYQIDTDVPVISCAKQIVVTVPEGQSATVNYAPTAYDECEGVIPVVCDPEPGSSFAVGNHVVECTATDSAGNEATASFNVVVLVQQPVNSDRFLDGVSVRGDDAEGTGVAPGATILAINNAFLNDNGDVVFDASLQGNGANNSAVFFRPDGGSPAPVAAKGASFEAGAYGIFSHLSLNDAGDIGFQSLTSGNLPGHFAGPGAGPVANSARRLGASPSGGVYNGLYQPALASNGELLTPAALLLGNGGVTSLNDSVITSSAGTVVAREGSATGTGDLTHGQFLARVVASDSGGRYAFPSLVFGSTPAGGNAGIFVGTLGGGSPSIAVRKGDAAAGTPGTFSSFLGESVNSDGEIALRAFAIGGGITAADNEGIWTNSGNTSAPPVLVAREGDVTPCIAGGMVAFSSFGTIYMGDDGSVCFLAYLKDSDAAPFAMVNASNDASIWLWRNGALDLIVREGDLANSTDGAVVGRIVDFDSNGDAAGGNGIAYSVEFAPISGDTTSRTNQAVYVDRGGEDLAPVLVLRRGDKFTVGEDEVDVLSLRISSAQAYTPSGSTGGFGRAINGDGDVLLNVGFTGSKSGIFVLGSPPDEE